jgi:hypothetical protein
MSKYYFDWENFNFCNNVLLSSFYVKVLLIKILDLIWLNMLCYNLTSNVTIRDQRINKIYYKLNHSKTKNTVIIERHKRYLIFIY